jgi:potassium/hydrogen antiporter
MSDSQIVLSVGVLLMFGMAATSVASRLGIPAFALCLFAGMAAGSDGIGLVNFDDYLTAQRIGTACLALILFEGGWRANPGKMWPVWGTAARLAVPGTILTALSTAFLVTVVLRRPPIEGLLIGSILASTDGAAVFALMRKSRLPSRLSLTLEAEAGLNDPVAIFLVISAVTWTQQPGGVQVTDLFVLFGKDLLVGLAIGLAIGVLGALVFKSDWLPSPGLYAAGSVALAAVAYGAAQELQGSGFLAVYVAGLVLGDQARRSHEATTIFQQGLVSIADVALFVTLGLVVSPSDLGVATAEGVAIGLILALIARPLAVFALTAGDRFSGREKVVLSWAGLRGAVPVILATIPITEGLPHGLTDFNLVFVAVITSAILQGMTVGPLSQLLGLTAKSTTLAGAVAASGDHRGAVLEATYGVLPASDAVGRTVRDLHLPGGVALTLIVRSGSGFHPSNSTRIQAGDVLHFLVPKETAEVFRAHLASWAQPAWLGGGPPAADASAAAPADVQWAPLRRAGLHPSVRSFIASERLWWQQLFSQLRVFAARLVSTR